MQALKAPSPQPSPMDKWEREQEIRTHAAQAKYLPDAKSLRA
jgi:hypothetical protein